jgi:uridylate kinase
LGEASRYDRVVLKLSGEVFADAATGSGIDAAVVQRIAEELPPRARLGSRSRSSWAAATSSAA